MGSALAASKPGTVTIPMLTETAASKSSKTMGCSTASRMSVAIVVRVLDVA